MTAKAGIFIIISLLVLVGTVAAHLPDASTIETSNPSWVIANGADQATITVKVSNLSLVAMQGAAVTFTIDDSDYGSMSPASTLSDFNGNATSTFRVNTKSGVAVITATIISHDGYTVTKTITQNINHDTPYYDPSFSQPLFTYPPQGIVATEVPFKISMYDRWGNSIDNRLDNHTISLHVSSPLIPDNCGFNDSGIYKHDLSIPLEADGTLSVDVKLTTKSGLNYVRMDSIGDISFKSASIKAVAGGVPVSITGTIYPEGVLPANNEDKFTIDYFLYDIYGNPMANRSISISTNLSGETAQTLHTSDSNGLIRFYYGPKISIITANITAIANDNTSVTKNLIAHFGNATPTIMVLGITPQTMASREVDATEQAFVRATVIDNFGNPVQGELVTFSLGTPSVYPYSQTVQPSLSDTTAITDKYGNAIVHFYPGSFAMSGEPGWSSSATGSVDITAIWNGKSKHVPATWKNYAYLSIEASAVPPIVKLGETVDITIDVIGNGFIMPGGNVAAIMDLDSSSSIWSNPDTPGPKRIDSAKEAAKAFAIAMLMPEPTTNWIGVNSFGNEKKDDDRLLSPQNNYTPLVEPKITNLVRGTNSQGFGDSIRDSINNLTLTQGQRGADKVRAVVVLKDSGGGNLEANGQTEAENDAAAVIALAKSSSPKTMIFTVYYYDGVSESSSTQRILQNIANSTGGKFFRSENSTQLKLDFIEIANILKTQAGVNASMNLNFQQQEVNGTSIDGSEVFIYVPVPDPTSGFYNLDSTPKSRDSVLGRTRIMWMNSSHSVINQSDDWQDDYQLYFNIGTINIGERWNATYRLKVNQTGLINMFNCTSSASYLSYNNGAENLCLPNLYITVNPNTTYSGSSLLNVSDLVPQTGNFTDSVLIQWKLKYTGYEPKVTERYYYCYNDAGCQQPVEFSPGPISIPSNSSDGWEKSRNYTLDLTNFPPGEYRIKVIASVPGFSPNPPAEDWGAFTKPWTPPEVNFRLK